MMFNRLLFRLSLFIIVVSTFVSCDDDDDNPVPEVVVNRVFRNIEADAQYNSLLTINNAVIIKNEGYRNNGIIVYRQKIDGGEDDFLAYDLTCTHELGSCVMDWNSSDAWYLTCQCCGSRFNIIGEYMESGPAQKPLRKYRCLFSNGNLYISNF